MYKNISLTHKIVAGVVIGATCLYLAYRFNGKRKHKQATHLSEHKSTDSSTRRAEKRIKAITELIQTEATYINRLNICIKEYYNGLSKDEKIINADDLRGIFNDIQTIYQLNTTFLQDLKSSKQSDTIGEQFIKFCPYFKMYQHYCNNYDNAIVLLQKYNNKQSFINYCNQAKQRCSNKTLQSLLITPIQRLPR
eukprot:491129_1